MQKTIGLYVFSFSIRFLFGHPLSIKNILEVLQRLLDDEKALQGWYCWAQRGGQFAMDRFVWKIKWKIFPAQNCLHQRGYLISETQGID